MVEEVNVPVEETGDTPEYIQEMVNKAEGKSNNEDTETLLAGKYKNEEELSKGTIELIKKQHGDLETFYKSLESDLGKEKEEPAQEVEDTPSDDVEESGITEIEEKSQEEETPNAEIDYAKYNDELAANGELSEDSYKELAGKGLPKELVDTYIEGLKANAERTEATVIKNTVGSKENYIEMVTWAKDNLSNEQIQAYNQAINSNDHNQVELAISGLYSKFQKAEGSAPTNLLEGDKTSSGVSGYGSMAEMKSDMADPRYSKDPAFRQKVMDKVRSTTAF